ncbi:MAG: hypothetical protein WCR02_07375 [Sphaerochaetaceae bacterium]
MDNTREYEDIIQKLKDASVELQKAIGQLEARIADSEQPNLIESAPVKVLELEKKYTFVEVRTIIAGKAREGYTAIVKMLLAKHGATKLSEIKEEDYSALVNDAEEYCRKISVDDINSVVEAIKAGPNAGQLDALFEHQTATCSNDLREEYYAAFLWDARRLIDAR